MFFVYDSFFMPSFKHGVAVFGKRTRAYRIWTCMRNRCRNGKGQDYKYYGGRGIAICPRWDEFLNFLEDMGDPPPGMTLERKDNDGPYCLKNCKWDTRKAQGQNRPDYNKLTLEMAEEIRKTYVRGVTRQVDVGKQFGVSQSAVSYVIRGTRWTI